jgi:hypothetical protein
MAKQRQAKKTYEEGLKLLAKLRREERGQSHPQRADTVDVKKLAQHVPLLIVFVRCDEETIWTVLAEIVTGVCSSLTFHRRSDVKVKLTNNGIRFQDPFPRSCDVWCFHIVD